MRAFLLSACAILLAASGTLYALSVINTAWLVCLILWAAACWVVSGVVAS